MSRDFAIGCMRGGGWAFGAVALVSFLLAMVTLQFVFVWLTLPLVLAALLLVVLKIELERDSK